MKWNELIALRISELIVQSILKDERIQLNHSEEIVRKRVNQIVQANFEQEKELVKEVYQMMEDLEQKGHSFERPKMFPLLKAQLAKKKGFIL